MSFIDFKDFKIEDYFTVVYEPGYSNKKLKEFENTYNKNSIDIYEEYKKGNNPINNESDFYSWVHYFIINVQNDGIYSNYDLKKGDNNEEAN